MAAEDVTEKQAKMYCRMMNDVSDRLQHLRGLGVLQAAPGEWDFAHILQAEAAFLCIRKMLETIAFSSLVANQKELEDVLEHPDRYHTAEDVLKLAYKANPHFYPVPIRLQIAGRDKIQIEDADTPHLTRGDFHFLYNACNKVIHVHSPLAEKVDLDLKRSPAEWLDRIRNLLETHKVTMSNGDVLIVQMHGSDVGRAVVHHAGL